MIVLIDNYDSFAYNLYQLLGSIEPDIRVVRNDALTVDELSALNPSAIVLSPGPGKPADAGICEEVVQKLTGRFPILGVCLGHQAICEALGGRITYATKLMHGKSSQVYAAVDCPLFEGLPPQIEVARYHSLEAEEDSLPSCLKVCARTIDTREVMAVEHTDAPTYGLQFHPESILTPEGRRIAENFVGITKRY